jgi:tetratricopeptide (TPR) repeat protein
VAAGLAACLLGLAGCGSVESDLDEVRSLQDAGQFDASIAPLRKLLADEPDNAEANYRLGIALQQTGRPSLAVWPLQKAAASEEFAVQAGLMLASTLSANDSHEEAIRAAARVLELEPGNRIALYTRGQAYLAAGKPENALEDAAAMLEIDASDHRAALLRGSALIDLGRADEAEEIFRRLANEADESGNPTDAVRKCAALATFYRSREDIDQARSTYEACLAKYPTHPMLQQWVADFYVTIGEPDAAIALWRDAVAATPEDLTLRAKLADLLYAQGDVDQARTVLTETVELFDTPEAWRMLASFERKTGNPKAAREALEQAMERTRNVSAPMRFALADMLIEEGDYERASEIAESLEEPAYRHLLRGAILLKQGDSKGALAAFDAGLRLWPNNAGARYLAGQAAQNLDDRERALAEYREAIRVDEEETDAALRMAELYFQVGEYSSAQQFAERHLRKRPYTDPSAHIIAARSAANLGRYERAETLLNDLRVKDPGNPTAYVEFAAVRRRSTGPEAALAVVMESDLDLKDPANVDALRSVASDYVALGRSDDAIALVKAAVAAHPESPDLLDLEGRVLQRIDKEDEAARAYEAALAQDESFAPALEALGTLARGSGDLDGAIALFERAAAADPTRAESAYLAGQTRLMQGNQAAAMERMEEALERDPSHLGANNDLAWLLASSGEQLDRALQLARRAVRVERNADTLDTLGYVYLQKGQADEAVSVLGKALEARPESGSIEYRLGMALAAKGEKEEARAVLTRALERPAFPEADAARAELARLQDS